MTAIRTVLSCTLLAVATAGCAAGSEVDISKFRRAGAPPTYWLGESFDGLPLETTDAGGPNPSFIYGTCHVKPFSDSGCAPPLELQQWPLLERSPLAFEAAPQRPAACRHVEAGELTAARFATTGGVEVYLGRRVVVVFASDERVPKVLQHLRPVKAQEPALPPPPRWVTQALERCKPPLG